MAPSRKRPDEKTDALRRQGVLHPNPDAIKDELFVHGGFFDRRDLVQVRYEMLRRVRVDERPVAETAARFGISRPTYYKVAADFAAAGLSGLVPRKRGPKGGHKLGAEVVEVLREALAQDPSASPESLGRLARDRFGIEVHPRSVARALERQKKKVS